MTVLIMSQNINRQHFRHRSDTSAELFEDADSFFMLPASLVASHQQQSSNIPSNQSSFNEGIDEVDTKKLITVVDRLNKKISRTKNAISREQIQRDGKFFRQRPFTHDYSKGITDTVLVIDKKCQFLHIFSYLNL